MERDAIAHQRGGGAFFRFATRCNRAGTGGNRAGAGEVLDNDAVKRIKEIQTLPFKEKDKIYSVIDALIRDYKTQKAYS